MDADFATTHSGAAETYPKKCSDVGRHDFIMIRGRPCKVCEMSTSKPGKHGHAKIHIFGFDIFTNKKMDDICPSKESVEIPVVERKEFEVLSIDEEDGFLALMDSKTCKVKDDLRLPGGEMGNKLRDAFERNEKNGILVVVISACGEEAILDWKPKKD